MATDVIPPFADDAFRRVLCVVAHPDDVEYGVSSAVAAWTARGVDVAYLLLTRGEAGMDGSPPERTAPLRTEEQIAGSRAVGVAEVEFLDHPDGVLEYSLGLLTNDGRVKQQGRRGRHRAEPGRPPGGGPGRSGCTARRGQPVGLPRVARRGPGAAFGAVAAGGRGPAADPRRRCQRGTGGTRHRFPGSACPVPGRDPWPSPAPADDHRHHPPAGTSHGRAELFRAWDFHAPPPIAAEAMAAAQDG